MRRVHLMAFLLAALPHSAHAQDYPFTGAFTAAGRTDAPDPDDPARCALAFFTQSPSGAYVNYVVDMNAFNTTQTLHHRVAAAFARCPFDPARLTAALSTDVTRLPPDKSLALISPDATLLDAPITADLMKAAGLSKP